MSASVATMSSCRACTGRNLFLYLPLGDHPPANAFLRPERLNAPEPKFSLDTHVCLDCGLIQVPDKLPPDFFEDYLYVPSASETMRRHFKGLASRFKELVTDKRWRGYARYLGGLCTRVSVNTDLPFPAADLVHLASHEIYGGHHTHRVWQEADLVRERGQPERTVRDVGA